jgi:hypothetical protein
MIITVDKIKELAKQCNIQELDGYMADVWSDQDELMRVRADQFTEFCKMLAAYINSLDSHC